MRFRVQAIEAWRGCDSDEGDFPCARWDINAWHNCGEIEVPENSENKDLYMILVEEGYLKPKAKDMVYSYTLECNELIIRIYSLIDHEPLYELTEIAV